MRLLELKIMTEKAFRGRPTLKDQKKLFISHLTLRTPSHPVSLPFDYGLALQIRGQEETVVGVRSLDSLLEALPQNG